MRAADRYVCVGCSYRWFEGVTGVCVRRMGLLAEMAVEDLDDSVPLRGGVVPVGTGFCWVPAGCLCVAGEAEEA